MGQLQMLSLCAVTLRATAQESGVLNVFLLGVLGIRLQVLAPNTQHETGREVLRTKDPSGL